MNNTTSDVLVLPDYIAWTSLVLCSIVLAVGVLGNLLVIVVILTSKVLRSSTNLFLLNLSVADLLVLLICTPSVLVEIATRSDAWIMGKAMCYLIPFIELSVSHTSILTILAITVERYYAICLPLRAGVVCTKSKACLTCLIAWISAFVLSAPILGNTLYTTEEGKAATCLTLCDTYWQKFYFIFMLIVFFFIPLLVLIILYLRIARNLVPAQSNDGDEQVIADSASVLRSRKQVVTMIATVVVFFFVCMFPIKILTLWIVTLPVDVLEVIDINTYLFLIHFSRVMFYINSAINPILYNIMSSKFREGFRKVFHCVEWPLTPQRFRATSSSNDWRRKTTYTSSTYTSQKTRSTCRLELTQRETNTDPLGENKDILLPNTDRCQSRSHLENECSREKASANDQRPSIHEENIVFIEERKILVIPKSKTSIT